jgi:ribosomal protein S27E
LRQFYKGIFDFDVNYIDFDPNREDAYVLIGNHPCLHDGVYASTFLKNPPKPVINAFMFVSWAWKFLLTRVYPSIAKRKGQNDIVTVRSMMKTLNSGRGIMLFPEGNSSYFGEQSDVPFSTFKFLKKVEKDIVICKVNGAYLTAPRWGEVRTKKGKVEMNFIRLIKGEEIKNLSVEEISSKIIEAIKFNDFDWNREHKNIYKNIHRAEGIERFIYICPKCMSHQTITGKGNSVYCSKCGEIAKFNSYTLLEGLDFDNLVDWSKLQSKKIPELAKIELHTTGRMFDVDTTKYKQKRIGKVKVSIIDDELIAQHRKKKYSFGLDKIFGITLTRKDEVSFDYEEKTYFIKLKDPMLFYEIIKYKKGDS